MVRVRSLKFIPTRLAPSHFQPLRRRAKLSNICKIISREHQRQQQEAMMMRLRGQALAMSSSSYSLLRRVPSSPRSIVRCSSTRPLVSYPGFRVAPSPATASARQELRGTSSVVLRSRLSRVSVRASSHQASDAGSIDSSMMQSMENKIKEQLHAETVIVKDAYGDGRHVSIYVVSTAFEGQSAVNRQRMVYKAIWEEVQSTVHAVDQMVTNTPAEANKNLLTCRFLDKQKIFIWY